MSHFVLLGYGGLVNIDHIVAISRARSAPILRLLQSAGSAGVLNLTYGYPRESVVLLDTGHLAVTSVPLEEFTRLLGAKDEPDDSQR